MKIISLTTGEQSGGISPHAATHATAGGDPISAEAIGAEEIGAAAKAVSAHVGAANPHSQYLQEVIWPEVKEKPSTFTPATHGNSHKPGGSDYYEPLGSLFNWNFADTSFNNKIDTGFHQINYPSANSASFGLPFNTDWVYLFVVRHSSSAGYYAWQTVSILRDTGAGGVPFQAWTRLIFNGVARPWEKLLHRDSGRIDFIFAAGWAAFSSTFYLPFYRKHGELVQLSGLVKRTTSSDALITTLPAGFRPFSRKVFTVLGLASGASTPVLARIDVERDGLVLAQAPTPSVALSWLSLDGINFFAA